MLRSIKSLYNYVLAAEDGETGRCKDFLFDQDLWTVRYMVADTGKWLPGRLVLISPISLGEPDWESRLFPVCLTKNQIAEAPSLDAHAPVSRQHEKHWLRHYGWPYYWHGEGLWGAADRPRALVDHGPTGAGVDQTVDPGETRLRSANEVTGYHLQATDGRIGHVADFIMDDETWTIRYLVADTRDWLPGRKVLVSPFWVVGLDWLENTMEVDLASTQIERSPVYDPEAPINREYEIRLYDFYGRPRYWA